MERLVQISEGQLFRLFDEIAVRLIFSREGRLRHRRDPLVDGHRKPPTIASTVKWFDRAQHTTAQVQAILSFGANWGVAQLYGEAQR